MVTLPETVSCLVNVHPAHFLLIQFWLVLESISILFFLESFMIIVGCLTQYVLLRAKQKFLDGPH